MEMSLSRNLCVLALLCSLSYHAQGEALITSERAARQQRRAQLRSEALLAVGETRDSMVNARFASSLSTGVGIGDLLSELDEDSEDGEGEDELGIALKKRSHRKDDGDGGKPEDQVVDLGEALAERVLVERHKIQKENRELHAELTTAQSEGDANIDKLSQQLQTKQREIAELQKEVDAQPSAPSTPAQAADSEQPDVTTPVPEISNEEKSASLLSVSEGAQEKELRAEVDDLKQKLASVNQASELDETQKKMRQAFMKRIKDLEGTRKHMVDALSDDRAKAAAAVAKAKVENKEYGLLRKGLSKANAAIRKAQKKADSLSPQVLALADKLNQTVHVRLGEESTFNDEKQQITNAALAKTKYLQEERDDLEHDINKARANATKISKHITVANVRAKQLQGELERLKKARDHEQTQIVTQTADVLKLKKQTKIAKKAESRDAVLHQREVEKIKAAALDKVHVFEDEREELFEDLGYVRGNASQTLKHFKADIGKMKQDSEGKLSDQSIILAHESELAANATAAELTVFKNQSLLQSELAKEWSIQQKDQKQETKQSSLLKSHKMELDKTRNLLTNSQLAAKNAAASRKAADAALANAKSQDSKASLAEEKQFSTEFLQDKSKYHLAEVEASKRQASETAAANKAKTSASTMQAQITKLQTQAATDLKNLQAKKTKWQTDKVALSKKMVEEQTQSEKDLAELKQRHVSDKTRLEAELKAYEKREADTKAQREADEAAAAKVKLSVDMKVHDLEALQHQDSAMSGNLTMDDAKAQEYSAQTQKLQSDGDGLRSANVKDTTERQREESIVNALKSQVQQAKATEATAAENMRQAAKVGSERDLYRSQLAVALKETSTWMATEETAHTEEQQSEKDAHAVSEQLEDVKAEDERHTTLLTKLLAFSKTEQDKMKAGVAELSPEQKKQLEALAAGASTSS